MIDLVRSNQEMTDERLDVLEYIMKQYESDSSFAPYICFSALHFASEVSVTLILKLY